MKITQLLGIILGISVLMTTSVQARDDSDKVKFSGKIIDGPFKQETITGFCKRNSRGDIYKQQTKCVIKMKSGFKIVDEKASLEVVGGYRALRIILGPRVGASRQKGNFKLSAFQATTFYDQDITLFNLPRQFSAVDVSIGGISVAGGSSTVTAEDCIIWDVLVNDVND